MQDEEDLAWLLDNYLAAEFLAIDIETVGLDPLTGQIRLVQMAAAGLPTLVVDLFQDASALSQIAPV